MGGYVLAVAILAVGAFGLWMRRYAFGNRWEKDTTAALVLIVGGATLTSPAMGFGGIHFLERLTGLWNVEQLLGSLFVLMGAGRICSMLIRRVISEPHASRCIHRWVDAPTGIGIILTWVCFGISGAFHDRAALSHMAGMGPTDDWIRSYWVVFSITMGYLFAFAIRLLLILRTEDRHQPVADIYLFACVAGLTDAVLSAVISGVFGYMTVATRAGLVTLDILFVGGFAWGAIHSWRRKVAPFNDALRTLRSGVWSPPMPPLSDLS